MLDINIDVKVSNSEYCEKCRFRTRALSLYYEPECILFDAKLKSVPMDKYIKCEECKKKSIEAMEDDE